MHLKEHIVDLIVGEWAVSHRGGKMNGIAEGVNINISCEADRGRLLRCINMAMGCLSPTSKNRDERLAWYRLYDALNGDEPRNGLGLGE